MLTPEKITFLFASSLLDCRNALSISEAKNTIEIQTQFNLRASKTGLPVRIMIRNIRLEENQDILLHACLSLCSIYLFFIHKIHQFYMTIYSEVRVCICILKLTDTHNAF